MLSTNTSGIVFFKSKNLMEGREVRAGEVLFTVSSKGLTEENLEERYRIAKARLERAKADFERSKTLLQEKVIAQKEFEERQMEMSIAEAEFQTLADNFKSEGIVFKAPFSGIIKSLPVSDGEFVEEGEALTTLTRNQKLLLEGEVSQRHLSQLQNIRSAHFKMPSQEVVHRIEDFNGKLVSYGKVMEQGEHHVPILFEVDNRGGLLAGSFVDLYLLTRPVPNALVIPKTALMQDYGQFYVYVQTGGESFEKREIKTGIDDGQMVQVLSGLEEGEWLVTRGAYQIKMASMSSAIPAHGHSH
jgi:RND family efflux transporter MFP subunit